MNKIKIKDLEDLMTRLNNITDSPQKPWSKDKKGKLKANIGNYHLSGAYGGWKVERIMNNSGGVTTPIDSGYVSKKELYKIVSAYIDGLYEGIKQ